ncbi:hypothetical protein FQN49_003382 [Arthroderma sp. PD_2]|nr:hypothetical protein FQN49_003382 [Arthroderma sp. PD_2]
MAPRKAKASKEAKAATPEASVQAGAETEAAEVRAVARPRKVAVGCLMLLVGDYEDKGEDVDYWRVRLGWAGEEEPRRVYYRWEAVGDPTQTGEDGQVPELRFVWLFETGEWADKAKLMRERAQKAQKEEEEREAAIAAAKAEEIKGRGGRRGRRGRQGGEGAVKGGDGAGHPPPEDGVRKTRSGKKIEKKEVKEVKTKKKAPAKAPQKRKMEGDEDGEPAGPVKKRKTRKARG